MSKGPRPIEIKPSSGGRLMSSLSKKNAGLANYCTKRDFRRFFDREVRSEGHSLFSPALFSGDIPMPAASGDITLSIQLRHPNGRKAIIVGTETTIWKYTGTDDPLYVVADYVDDDYVSEDLAAWKVIGSGFATGARRWEAEQTNGYLVLNNGVDLPMTYRLTDETVLPIYELRENAVASIGTIHMLNNILMCGDVREIFDSKHTEIMSTIPIGTFSQTGAQKAGVNAVVNSGVSGVAGNTITAASAGFNSGAGFIGLVGKTIRMVNGIERTIDSVTSQTIATLSGTADIAEPAMPFYILPGDGSEFNLSPISSTSLTVAGAGSPFVNGTYVFDGVDTWLKDTGDFKISHSFIGFWTLESIISPLVYYFGPAYTGGQIPPSSGWSPYAGAPPEPSFTLNAGASIPNLVGLKLYWDNGYSRTVVAVNGSIITVDDDGPIPSGNVSVENPLAYARFTDSTFIDRIQYRELWAMPDKPRRFEAVYYGTVVPSSEVITLDYPVKSVGFEGGDILVTGLKNGNLPCTVIASDGLRFTIGKSAIKGFYSTVFDAIDTAITDQALATVNVASMLSTLNASNEALAKAKTALAADTENADLSKAVATASADVDTARIAYDKAVKDLADSVTAVATAQAKSLETEEATMALMDAVGSIVGFEDLQGDGSAILKAKQLRSFIIIYTDTEIFIGRYTATPASPFSFQRIEIPESAALFYRNTLVCVNAEAHVFAGENQFMMFDMTGQIPVDHPVLGICAEKMFDHVSAEDMEKVFAFDNVITEEVWFNFPSESDDKALRFDYRFNSASTSSAQYFSGAWVQMPGTSENVFINGGSGGNVFKYGMVASKPKARTGTAKKVGIYVESTNDAFTIGDTGKTVVFANKKRFGIVKFVNSKKVEVCGTDGAPSQAFAVEPTCYHRLGQSYTSVLESGAESFGSESSEKSIDRYTVTLSSQSPDAQMLVTILSGRNENEFSDRFGFMLTPPKDMQPVMLQDFYLGDRIEVDGMNNPLEIACRTMSITGAASNSFGRRSQ